MNRRIAPAAAALALAVLAAPHGAVAGPSLPDWAERIRLAPHVAAAGEHARVLWESRSYDVQPDGRVQRTARGVVEIVDAEGSGAAAALLTFEEGLARVRELQAWLRTPAGEVLPLRREQAVDLSVVGGQLRTDVHQMMLSGAPLAAPGSVFAYTYEVDDRMPLAQFVWDLSHPVPVQHAELQVRVPAGWTVEARAIGGTLAAPAVDGERHTWTWQAENLPAVREGGDERALRPPGLWVGVSCRPPAGGAATAIATFDGWEAAARWTAGQMNAALDASGPLAMRTTMLAARARTRLDTLRAIGRHVQELPYESIELGIGRGGGYRPRPAAEVFAKGYGDCKDKVTLMRAMLNVVGIASRPVLVWSGDSLHVDASWPSPQQFNHCILAVAIDGSDSLASRAAGASRGPLVLFDPTDATTPFGQLPGSVQGGWAMFADEEPGVLFRVPAPGRTRARVARSGTLAIGPDGTLTGPVAGELAGADAERARTAVAARKSELVARAWLASEYVGAGLRGLSAEQDTAGGLVRLAFEIQLARASDTSQPGRLVLRPGIFATGLEGLRVDTLATSLRLAPLVADDTLIVHAPAGMHAGSLPEPADVQSAFGRYSRTCEWRDGALRWERHLRLDACTVPASELRLLRAFLDTIARRERVLVLLESDTR